MDRKLVRMILSRMSLFCTGILGSVADVHRRKFIPELLAGIAKAGSLVAADLARATQRVGETTCGAWKSIRHQLGSPKWDRQEEAMNRAFARREGRGVEALTPVVIDLSELVKPCARRMEHLDRVRDASASSKRGTTVTEPGYGLFNSITFGRHDMPVPLVNFLYSLQEGTFVSENAVLEHGCREIHQATGGRGLVVMDRRADAEIFLSMLQRLPMAFLVRLAEKRHLYAENADALGDVPTVARCLNLAGRMTLPRRVGRRTLSIRIRYGWRPVRLKGMPQTFTMIAVHGQFEHLDRKETEGWWYLLTNVPLTSPEEVEKLILAYRLRWKIEESIQFVKEELGLEKVRMLSFRRIRRLVALAFWIMALLAEIRFELSQSTLHKLYRLGRILRLVPASFIFYRLRRGLAVFFEWPPHLQKLLTICHAV